MVQTPILLRRESGLLLALARVPSETTESAATKLSHSSEKIVILNKLINVGGTSSRELTRKSYGRKEKRSEVVNKELGRINKEATIAIIGKLPGRQPRKSCWILKTVVTLPSAQVMVKITAGARATCQRIKNNRWYYDCKNWRWENKKPKKDCKKRLPGSRLRSIAWSSSRRARQHARRKSSRSSKRRHALSMRDSSRRRSGRPRKPLFLSMKGW